MPYSDYSIKQKKLAAVAGNKKKITALDLQIVRNRPKTKKKKNG